LLDIHEELADRGRIELCVFFDIELPIIAVEITFLVIESSALAVCILRIEDRRRTADEAANFAEYGEPSRRVESRVVDVADQRRELFIFPHGSFGDCDLA
jgi:hypothetical protein